MIGQSLTIPALALRQTPSSGLEIDFVRNAYRLNGVRHGAFADLRGATFSRAGAGTARRADGTWAAFAAGMPRITDLGLTLNDEARTNLFPRFAATAAQFQSNAGLTDVSEPAGAPIADLAWVSLTTTGTSTAYQTFASAVAGAAVHTLSVLVETPDGSPPVAGLLGAAGVDFAFRIAGGAGDNLTHSYQRQSGHVWRVVATVRSGLGGGAVNNGVARIDGNAVRALKFSGLQCEFGAFATSPIVTTGAAATREADVASIVVPVKASTWTATYDGGLTATGTATPGDAFDLVTERPWLNGHLQRLTMT